MNWNAINTIAALISMIAFVATAVYIRAELKAQEKDRFLAITNELFTTWQSREFMEAQLWLLHRLEQTTWPEFVQAHRADYGEVAFHRVGSFYDRLGTLIRLGLVDEQEILSTVAAHAIAVWQKIQPLVREARRIENSVLFDDFERLLPACHECYVPALGKQAQVRPFAILQTDPRITVPELKKRLDGGEPVTVLDVRPASQQHASPATLPGAISMPLAELEDRYGELPADREVVTYCA